jgi:hypothetical protein
MSEGKVLKPMAIVGYRFRSSPGRPDLKALEIVTPDDGTFPFVGTKAVLLRLSADLAKVVATMTDNKGPH